MPVTSVQCFDHMIMWSWQNAGQYASWWSILLNPLILRTWRPTRASHAQRDQGRCLASVLSSRVSASASLPAYVAMLKWAILVHPCASIWWHDVSWFLWTHRWADMASCLNIDTMCVIVVQRKLYKFDLGFPLVCAQQHTSKIRWICHCLSLALTS